MRLVSLFLLAILFLSAFPRAQADSIDRATVDLSPLNSRRPSVDPQKVKFIILHNIEGRCPGCLGGIKRKAKVHFVVRVTGEVVRILDVNKLANHAGFSMWNGKHFLNGSSIGIEIEGYTTSPPNLAQRAALKVLITDLRVRFNIPEDHVMPHSMVAYGPPNRYWGHAHRGRKRCAMSLGRRDIRWDLGLTQKPSVDPDVKAKRLIVADQPLFAFLFNEDAGPEVFNRKFNRQTLRNLIAQIGVPKEAVAATTAPASAPANTLKPGNERPLPPPQKPLPLEQAEVEPDDDYSVEFMEIGSSGEPASVLAGNQSTWATTIYFFPPGTVRTGAELVRQKSRLLDRLPPGTKVLVGYVYGGQVSANRSAYKITKDRWNDPATIYRWPDKTIKTGDEVDPVQIPVGTIVLFQR